MSYDRISNDKFGTDENIMLEAGENDRELFVCIFSDANPQAWIEITHRNKNGEMRFWKE